MKEKLKKQITVENFPSIRSIDEELILEIAPLYFLIKKKLGLGDNLERKVHDFESQYYRNYNDIKKEEIEIKKSFYYESMGLQLNIIQYFYLLLKSLKESTSKKYDMNNLFNIIYLKYELKKIHLQKNEFYQNRDLIWLIRTLLIFEKRNSIIIPKKPEEKKGRDGEDMDKNGNGGEDDGDGDDKKKNAIDGKQYVVGKGRKEQEKKQNLVVSFNKISFAEENNPLNKVTKFEIDKYFRINNTNTLQIQTNKNLSYFAEIIYESEMPISNNDLSFDWEYYFVQKNYKKKLKKKKRKSMNYLDSIQINFEFWINKKGNKGDDIKRNKKKNDDFDEDIDGGGGGGGGGSGDDNIDIDSPLNKIIKETKINKMFESFLAQFSIPNGLKIKKKSLNNLIKREYIQNWEIVTNERMEKHLLLYLKNKKIKQRFSKYLLSFHIEVKAIAVGKFYSFPSCFYNNEEIVKKKWERPLEIKIKLPKKKQKMVSQYYSKAKNTKHREMRSKFSRIKNTKYYQNYQKIKILSSDSCQSMRSSSESDDYDDDDDEQDSNIPVEVYENEESFFKTKKNNNKFFSEDSENIPSPIIDSSDEDWNGSSDDFNVSAEDVDDEKNKHSDQDDDEDSFFENFSNVNFDQQIKNFEELLEFKKSDSSASESKKNKSKNDSEDEVF